MFHLTAMTDERIRELHATASELRAERTAGAGRSPLQHLRVFLGTAFLAAGSALVSGARPAATSRAGR